jgi:hypothetical protein
MLLRENITKLLEKFHKSAPFSSEWKIKSIHLLIKQYNTCCKKIY